MKDWKRITRRLLTAVALASSVATLAHGATTARIDEHMAPLDGVTLHYLQTGTGSGTPIVLLHGYAETSHMWRPLMPQLADRHVVIAPDLRGAGTSSKPDGGYDKKTMAADIHALVKSLGFTKVRIVGHDIGLMVAYAYAAQYPDETESIVLMDAFLPGVGDWTHVWLLRDLWHFHFYGETPLALVQRAGAYLFRTLLERLRRRSQPLDPRGGSPLLCQGSYAQPGRTCKRRFRVLPEAFRSRMPKDFAELRQNAS